MKNDKLTPREELKTYFETGKYPTQNQFSELIDSLQHKGDALTNKEMVLLANRLAIIDNAFIYYNTNSVGDLRLPIVVSSQDEEDQVITVKNTDSAVEKQFILGSPPYILRTKKASGGNLKETEYYIFSYQISQNYMIYRLFGNNLDTVPEGFELGAMESKRVPVQIAKQDFGKKINIVNTNVKFINKTQVPIEYRVEGITWSNRYRSEDTVTDHYDAWDNLTFYYKADLREINQSILCEIYDEDNNSLLTTGNLNAGQSHSDWYGGQVNEVRNIRIECKYEYK
ncbi:hypothetical protein [Chryseobacterium sp. ON_d1]|uniref:hypothetical protein n=1 Tax=Chryseobacterium sp. ON_d1 TaxID=2583211 RepID=UPI00115B0331|nr:hypothetical protein [Chryseobacterium sp. ON_d1]GEJ45801.1 hypothetical protein CRS_24090 [Chryseobacterium sp. ON_d1]